MSSEQVSRIIRLARYWVTFIGPRRLVVMVISAVSCVVVGWFLVKPTPIPVDLVASRVTVTATTLVTSSSHLTVHVTGAVKQPGVYTIPSRSRIVDALTAAGGATPSADLERINLAQTVLDAEQIHIPRRTSAAPRVTTAPRLRPRPRTSTTVSTPQPVRLININTATTSQLETLSGVGPSLAKAIVTYRTQKGLFTKVEDLLNVPGIGPSKLAALRNEVTVG